jgi:CHASE3 domain sensor protein
MIKINSKTGLMLIASCGAALGLVGVSFLNNASTKVYATGGTTTKSVVYDAYS